MAQRLVLHVGAMKSGTSYLQTVLDLEAERLAAHGIAYPGGSARVQARAVFHRTAAGKGPGARHWRQVVDEVRRAPGTAVVSTELLGPVRPAAVAEIVEELGAGELRIVITARDLNRVLPSMWQETIQNGRTWSWADYLDEVAALRPGHGDVPRERGTAAGSFWRQQHVVRLVRRWVEVAGLDGVRLVTVPHPGAPRSALLDRFAEATGLPLQEPAEVPVANESLGLPSTLALLRMNRLLTERGLPFRPGGTYRKRLAKNILAARREEEPVLGLPVAAWVREQAADTAAALRETGVRVVGDLADLEPVDVPGARPQDVPETEVAAAAVAALAGLVERNVAQLKDQSKTGTQTSEDDDTE